MGRRKALKDERVELHERVLHWLQLLADAGLPHLKPEARELLQARTALAGDYEISLRAALLHLEGIGDDMSPSERRRYEEAPEALRIATLYWTGETAPKPTFLGTGSGWSWEDRETAWSPSSGVNADVDRRVRLSWRPRTPPFQLDLDLDP